MKRIHISCLVFFLITAKLFSQENEFSYNVISINELQYNIFNKNERTLKYANLHEFESSLSTDRWWKGGLFEASFWSLIESLDRSIVINELSFSNIEDDTYWILCSKLGYQHTIGNMNLFVGIRNMSVDYFTSPYSLLFTNSSAGIYPTTSMNHNLANCPLSAMGIHAEYNGKKWNFKNSFYNGLNDANNKTVFKTHFNPRRNGYTNISQVQYSSSNGIYAAGAILDKQPQTAINHSLYALIEQSVFDINNRKVGIIGQLGYAPKHRAHVDAYYGGGIVVSDLFQTDRSKNDMLGLIAFCANSHDYSETAIELTYSYTVNAWLSIQPAFHYIHNEDTDALVGLIRGIITFGN